MCAYMRIRPHGQTTMGVVRLSGVPSGGIGIASSRLRRLSGLGDAAADSTATSMVNEGYDPNVIYPLVTAGANAAQLQDVWNNYGAGTPEFATAAAALMSYLQSGLPNIPAPSSPMQTSTAGAVYGAATSTASTPTQATASPTAPPAPSPTNVATISRPAGVPAGTELLYQVTWAAQTLATQTPQDIEATVAAALAAKWGIQVVSSSATSNFFINQPTFSIYVVTNVDYGQPNDVKAIIDGEVYNAGRKVQASSISIVKPGSGPGTAPSLTLQWFEDNALWIGLGVFALLYLLPPAGRRR